MPVLAKLKEYLLKIRDEALPKSEAGKAIAYALKNWVRSPLLPGRRPFHRQQPHGTLVTGHRRWPAQLDVCRQ